MMEGCYRDVTIALANELCMTAEEIGVEFYKARSYATTNSVISICPHRHGRTLHPCLSMFLIKAMEGERFENVRLFGWRESLTTV